MASSSCSAPTPSTCSRATGCPAWAGILAAPFVLALVGLAARTRCVIRRFYAAPIIAMLGTYAIGLVIREIVRGLLGGHYKSVHRAAAPASSPCSASTSRSGAASSSSPRSWSIAGTWLFLAAHLARPADPRLARESRRSRAPAASRPPGSTPSPSPSAPALAGLAGALIVPLYQLSADIGMRFLVQAFLSVMLGGVGTFEGPVLGAAAGRRHGRRPAVARHPGARRPAGLRASH